MRCFDLLHCQMLSCGMGLWELWAYFGKLSGFLTFRCFSPLLPFGVPQVRTPASKLSARSRVPWAAQSRTLNAWLASSLAIAAVASIISPRRSRIRTWRFLKNCGSGIISTVRHVSPLIEQG